MNVSKRKKKCFKITKFTKIWSWKRENINKLDFFVFIYSCSIENLKNNFWFVKTITKVKLLYDKNVSLICFAKFSKFMFCIFQSSLLYYTSYEVVSIISENQIKENAMFIIKDQRFCYNIKNIYIFVQNLLF